MRGLPGITQGELESQLADIYGHQCCDHSGSLNNLLGSSDGEEEAFRLVMEIWHKKRMPDQISEEMTTHFASKLWSGVQKGFGDKLADVDYDTPDFVMLKKLQESVFHFSAAKNYHQLKALSQALLNNEGKLRTWSEFKEEAHKINDAHVNHWLKAEYEMAVASGQMASTWTRIMENEKELPLLKFDAVNDNRTSPVCKDLDGVIRPVNDTFWDVYYPPNHWGCRSDVQQLAHGQITPADKIITPEKMPQMFKTNLAKNGLAFPKDHPYFKGLPEKVNEQASDILAKFKPAETLKEAEAFALETGLAKKVSFKGLAHVEVANSVNEVLLQMKQETGITYDEIIVKQATKNGRSTYLMANASRFERRHGLQVTGEHYSLYINKAFFNKFQTFEDIQQHVKKNRERRWTIGEDVKDIVWHELGHRLTEKPLYENDYQARLERPVFDYENLGKYASSSVAETMAEIYSLYRKGGQVPEEWKEKFNKWSILKIK